jgi:hypothetical protein
LYLIAWPLRRGQTVIGVYLRWTIILAVDLLATIAVLGFAGVTALRIVAIHVAVLFSIFIFFIGRLFSPMSGHAELAKRAASVNLVGC